MSRVRALLSTAVLSAGSEAYLVRGVLTGVGVFTFLAGVLILPALAPTRVELFILLLLLGVFALASAAVGQLAVVVYLLEKRAAADGERVG